MYQDNLKEASADINCISKFKLIIMDLGMPNKDGFEATKEILEFNKDKNIKIVALTSF